MEPTPTEGPARETVPLPSILPERWENPLWRAASARAASEKHPAYSEDVVSVDPELGLFILCDGMGGQKHGLEAATTTAATIRATVESLPRDIEDGDVPRLVAASLAGALRDAHDAISQRNTERAGNTTDEKEAMDTTATVMQVWPLSSGERLAIIGHVGDCRAYLVSEAGEVTQVTEDDDLLSLPSGARLVLGDAVPDADLPARIREVRAELEQATNAGNLSAPAKMLYAYRMVSVGVGSATMTPHTYVVPFPPGSRIALVSDGVYENLGARRMGGILTQSTAMSPERQALELVTAAQKNGHDKTLPTSKQDDISALIIESS